MFESQRKRIGSQADASGFHQLNFLTVGIDDAVAGDTRSGINSNNACHHLQLIRSRLFVIVILIVIVIVFFSACESNQFLFFNVKVGPDLLNVIVVFEGFYQLHYLLCFFPCKLNPGLRNHGQICGDDGNLIGF